MNIEEIREYCLSHPNTFEDFPFDDTALTFKVTLANGKSKMFALVALDNPHYILLKCDPEQAVVLRERHPEIEPGYHMNKRHWNGVRTDGALPDSMVREMIDNSYKLVNPPKRTSKK